MLIHPAIICKNENNLEFSFKTSKNIIFNYINENGELQESNVLLIKDES